MSDYKIRDHTEGRDIDVAKRKEGEDKLEDFAGELELELVKVVEDGENETLASNWDDGPEPETSVEVVDENQEVESQSVNSNVTALEDPEANLPSWMLSEIQHGNGDTGIDLNKDGTQVVAGALGLEVNAECEVSAAETDYEYCRYRATVVRPDGRTFNAVGDCHIDESGKSKWDLERQAETRAKKRAVKWTSAGGIEALGQ